MRKFRRLLLALLPLLAACAQNGPPGGAPDAVFLPLTVESAAPQTSAP